ncbi:hypothetical protein FPV67DRAFT_1365322, partial [Lyophyllum atratum]
LQEVLVPGALIVNGTHGASNKQPLGSFGEPPFHVVCLRNHLRHHDPSIPSAKQPRPQLISGSEPQQSLSQNTDADDGPGFGALFAQISESGEVSKQRPIESYVPDPISEAEGQKILGEIGGDKWVELIRSGTLKDPFHVFNMFYISAGHGLLHDFAIALRDAMFIWDQADKSRISTWGQSQNPPQSWDSILFQKPRW